VPRFDLAEVRSYYDRQTPAFIAFGQGGSAGAIHRAVWGPGVGERSQAFHYVEDQIAERMRRLPRTSEALHVVDLGCGVGSSLCYLAGQLPIRGTGITLSPLQAALATQRIRQRGLSDRVVCIEGDYSDLPSEIAPADFAYAIESFVHGAEPTRFFAQCRQLIRPGGVLAICDDFRRQADSPAAARAIDRFCHGWQINSLLEPGELRALASAAGFEHESTVDLSPYLELHRTRDRVISALIALFGWLPLDRTRFRHLLGGRALQTCLDEGWIGYELAFFRRPDLGCAETE
jgi:SAM-dependent methyltransferase